MLKFINYFYLFDTRFYGTFIHSYIGRNIFLRYFASSGQVDDYSVYYQILHLQNNSDQDQVRAAFLKLVKKYHPDSGSSEADADKFYRIETAYRKLQDKFASERWNSEAGAGEYGLYYKEKTVPDFDIKHTAPQHRQYLSYEGFGSGTPQQRQKQYQKFRARTAIENVYNHRISKISAAGEDTLIVKDKEEAKKIKIRSEMERLVEDLIQESMARGDFDNLTGSGKPLPQQNTNPYVDFVTHKMNQVLIDNGYVPEWITLQKEILHDTEKIRDVMLEARSELGYDPLDGNEVEKWQEKLSSLESEIKQLNKKINDFNLMVPLLDKQKVMFRLDLESKKILKEGKTKYDVTHLRKRNNNKQLHSYEDSTLMGWIESIFAK